MQNVVAWIPFVIPVTVYAWTMEHIATYSRHSSIRYFLIKKFSIYSPIEPWHKNNNSCLTWDCSIVRAPMRMKIAVGFFHTLIIMKILVLPCALHISKFCVVL